MRKIYLERKSYIKYDEQKYAVYLNEEVVQNYVPEGEFGGNAIPVTAYSYEGTMTDGSTIIDAVDASRDSLINGIIRSKFSQSEEDAIKTHQLQVLRGDIDDAQKQFYNAEWGAFNEFREFAKASVDAWLDS